MQDQGEGRPTPVAPDAGQSSREWAPPTLEEFDLLGTTQAAKNPSSFENVSSYPSPPVS